MYRRSCEARNADRYKKLGYFLGREKLAPILGLALS